MPGTSQETATKRRRSGESEPPRLFHIYKHGSAVALCGASFTDHGGKARLSDASTRLPQSGYMVCGLCALALQMVYGYSEAEADCCIRLIERDCMRKRNGDMQ